MDANSFARSVVAVQVFLNKIIDGVEDEFLAWPVEVMSDWAASCSLFRQSLNYLSRSHRESSDAQSRFPAETQDVLEKAWNEIEIAARQFSTIGAGIHQRIECADGAKEHLQAANRQLSPVTLKALSTLELNEVDLEELSPSLIKKVFPISEQGNESVAPSPRWDRLFGYLGELEFAIRYSDRLRICMLTRQMLMHWLHNSVDEDVFALASPMTHQLCNVTRQALWRLERPTRLEELDESDFQSDSIEGQAVFKRYRFFYKVLNSEAVVAESRTPVAVH